LILTFEIALPLGAIAFYVYDSVLLVHGNELLFVRVRRRWHAVGGSNLVLLGKRACLPALLQPWALVFRTFWSAKVVRADLPLVWPTAELLRALRPLRVIASALLVLLVGALPAASLAFGSGLLLLGVFALYYLLVIVALALTFARREVLGLQGRAYWSVALDAFACAPFAVNLVHRITLRQNVPIDAIAFRDAWLAPAERTRATALLQERVDEYIAAAPAQSAESLELLGVRERVMLRSEKE
jgi:hypothetical protein